MCFLPTTQRFFSWRIEAEAHRHAAFFAWRGVTVGFAGDCGVARGAGRRWAKGMPSPGMLIK